MNAEKITIVEISDVHLGHAYTSTDAIISNLEREFSNESWLSQVDIFFIAGDFFDSLLQLPDYRVYQIRRWISWFLHLCKKYDIVLRILEGTPSHDWKQSRLFPHLNELLCIGADVNYVETLSIEYMERFGITVLYCPDEWKTSCEETWLDVKALLEQHRLESVDFACMHGAFEYQIPYPGVSTHSMDNYLSCVNYLIFIGHVHLYSQYERIFSAGSFDRIAHGEEGAKGYLYATVYKNASFEVKFIENKGAATYKTIDVRGKETEDAFHYVETVLKTLSQTANVRLHFDENQSGVLSLDELRKTYPTMRFSQKKDAKTMRKIEESFSLQPYQRSLRLDSETLPDLVKERLDASFTEKEHCERAMEYLDGCLREYRAKT